MTDWQETAKAVDRIVYLAEAGKRAAVATVVRIEGSAYRRPGAKFLVEEGGQTLGGVSGGCLEADVREVALAAMRDGVPRLLHYDTGSDEQRVWGLGLGCNGSVDVFVQPATSEAALLVAARVKELLKGETPFAVSTLVEGPGYVGSALVLGSVGVLAGSMGGSHPESEIAALALDQLAKGESALHAVGAGRVFTEVYLPPPHLIVFGAGDDSIPLVGYAAAAGFRVTVVDHRSGYLTPERFPAATRLLRLRPEEDPSPLPIGPRSYVVLKTHSLAHDREWVKRLLFTEIPYIGLLGPGKRKELILDQIGSTGSHRVFGPVGLDLGAEGPEQIALSIVAELLAVRSGREPRHLRAREGTIHAA
ncbi:MAG TPA: XdhC family protein [Candidatus Methylomirabilis sp.]|nr:XdhC family protein [Candidatus Methylomirabilis sp.]